MGRLRGGAAFWPQFSLFRCLTRKSTSCKFVSGTFTSLFAKLSLQLSLCSCKRKIHHFHGDHIWQGLLSRPQDAPWKTRHITFQSSIPLYTPAESMLPKWLPVMNFDKKHSFFLLSHLWNEYNMYFVSVGWYMMMITMMWNSSPPLCNLFKQHQLILFWNN